MVIPLKEIIKLKTVDIDKYNFLIEKINNFNSQNEDVQSFLVNKSIDFENRNKACSFLYFNNCGELLGYFTLCVKNLIFAENVKGAAKQKIDGFRKDADSAVVYLIGQLGRDSRYSAKGFGYQLLNSAMEYLFTAQDIVGGRYCLVETENSESNAKVIKFYTDYGFNILQVDESDNYKQLVMKMESN